MSVKNFENMWTLLSDYKFEPKLDPCDNDLYCLLCMSLMIDATQSICGCSYCYKCISKYLQNKTKICVGKHCEEYLTLESITKIPNLNYRISLIKVKCPKENCVTVIELKKMTDHIRLCMKGNLGCPYKVLGCVLDQCTEKDLELQMNEMKINHSALLIECIVNMKNEMNEIKDQLKTITCKKCNEIEQEKLTRISLTEQSTANENLKVENQELNNFKKEVAELKNNISNELTKLHVKINKELVRIKSEINLEIRTSMEQFQGKFDEMNKLEIKFKEKIEKIEKIVTGMKTFEFVCYVDNVNKRMKRSTKGDNQIVHTEPVLVKNNSYSIKLIISFNEKESKYYLGIYFQIMPQMFDNILQWPFKHKVSIALVNQFTKLKYLEDIFCYDNAPNDKKHCFERPSEKGNEMYGKKKFIHFDDLKNNNGLIVNDKIFLKLSVFL